MEGFGSSSKMRRHEGSDGSIEVKKNADENLYCIKCHYGSEGG